MTRFTKQRLSISEIVPGWEHGSRRVSPLLATPDATHNTEYSQFRHKPGPVRGHGCLVTGPGRGWPLVIVVTVTFITRMEIMAKVKHFIIVNPMFQWLVIVSFS